MSGTGTTECLINSYSVCVTVSVYHNSFLSICPVSGFEGHNCENNVDDCPGHKCMNGGICVDGVNTYNCQCPPEWTGTALFTSYLKQNIYKQYIMMRMCELIFHISTIGQYCAEDVNECLMQPNACHNGGTCFNTIGGHTCVCVNGWTGDDCSENIDDCAIAVCFNGATCHDRVASFFCECPVGKTGKWVYQMASVPLLVLASML